MGLVNVRLDDVKEPVLAAEGEYDLRIVKVTDGESKKGNPMTTLVIRIEDGPDTNMAPVMYYINHITNDLPNDQKYMRALEIKRFLQVFSIEYGEDGFDTDDLNGATGRCLVVQREGEDGVVRNNLRLPRLKE